MDGYPLGSLDHNVPLLVASGLVSAPPRELELSAELNEQAIPIRSDLPPLDGKAAKVLASYLGDVDSRQDAWNGRDTGNGYKFRVMTTGRSFLFPPRRAKFPDHLDHPLSQVVLHSPFSPLSPSSPLYPDGIIDARWLQKHQDLVPSLYVPFYALDSDPNTASVSDNKLKLDIANVRSALAKSGYRTRLAVVMISETHPSPDDNIHERLDGIRKGAGLDPKTVFYIPPQEAESDLVEAADGILGIMFTQAAEYYRDISRHARKKRGRGTVPQPTVPPTSGTSQTLSLPGWHVRYDLKAAVFAEFRQEMDTALRLYGQCYDILLGPDVMDVIPSWSPRWNEARLLADITATRCLRCLLWTGLPTAAVRRWQMHRDRIRDLVDRRGRGTSNYGWRAWEARWAMVMAQVLERVNLPPFAPPMLATYILPEKALLGERIKPWDMLHHTGYWYQAAAGHLVARRALALSIPEEDRQAPDSSPASRVASRAFTYDTYLCPEPHEEYPLRKGGFNHSEVIVRCLMEARSQFQSRGQTRLVADLTLQAAKEMLGMKEWGEVVAMLRPVWEDMCFRNDGWWLVVEDLNWTLRRAAVQAGRGDLVLALDWELLDRKFTRRKGWHYDIARSLEDLPSPPSQMVVSRTDDGVLSPFVTASFAFRNKQGRSGEVCMAQLSITSSAHADSVPVTLERVTVEFDESLRPVIIDHDGTSVTSDGGTTAPRARTSVSMAQVSLKEEESDEGQDEDGFKLRGRSNLVLFPGQTNVYEIEIPLREPGTAQAVSVALSVQTESFHLHHSITLEGTTVGNDVWYGPLPSQHKTIRSDAHTIEVQPRPPKLEIKHVQVERQLYTSEAIMVSIEMINAEQDAVEAKLAVLMFGEPHQSFHVEHGQTARTAIVSPDGAVVSAFSIGNIAAGASTQALVRLNPVAGPTVYDATVKVSYYLVSDPATPIIQSMALRLSIVNPFESSFSLLHRFHADPWPSLFEHDGTPAPTAQDDAPPSGIAQKWCLHCHYASFAADNLVITEMDAEVVACAGGVAGVVERRPAIPEDGLEIAPRSAQEAQFDIVVQKMSIDDRGPLSMDLAFIIKWKRKPYPNPDSDSDVIDSSDTAKYPVNTSSIAVLQRQIVLGTEPRVLASISSLDAKSGLASLDIHIENASSHFLTFGVGMEPSDEFAFSGPKQTALHVLPMSRRAVSFRIVPLVRGKWVRLPVAVRDKYFQKVLRIFPTEGMKSEKENLMLWIPPRAEEGEEEEAQVEEL